MLNRCPRVRLLYYCTNRLNFTLLFIFFNYLTNHTQFIDCSHSMKRLYEDLFSDYNRLILPVANNKTNVTVDLNLKLGQILDLNLKQQILSTNVWVEQTWQDYKLEWEPKDYGGIDMIHVPAENIWIPDIVLFNNADGNYELTLYAKALLHSNGTVVWKPPTMFRSTCEIDVQYFPFDTQTCFLRFGSWTYTGDLVEIRHAANKKKVEIGIDLSQFYKNVEWDIIDVPAYSSSSSSSSNETYPDVTFKIVMRRKMLFYLVNLILPVALMTFMTVSVFYLPSDSNEKVTLSISILTSLIVFFLLMLEIIPPTSLAVPLFGKYLLFTLVLVSLSACVSVYVLNIHHRSPSVHTMSPRMRQLFLKTLPRLLRLDRPDPRERSSLNRFRKKKIAQQMLQASYTSKVYDMAQPLAASLNLIETLHRSYDFNPKDDDLKDDDDEGRYFRRYVDNYVNRLKRSRKSLGGDGDGDGAGAGGKGPSNNDNTNHMSCGCEAPGTGGNGISSNGAYFKRPVCCEHKKCCNMANEPYRRLLNNYQQQQRPMAMSCCDDKSQSHNEFQNQHRHHQHHYHHQYHHQHAGEGTVPYPPYGSSNGMTTKMTSLDINSSGACDSCSRRHGNNMANKQFALNPTMDYAERHSHIGMVNDDTLDITFDYDDQETTSNIKHSMDRNGGLFTITNSNNNNSNNNESKNDNNNNNIGTTGKYNPLAQFQQAASTMRNQHESMSLSAAGIVSHNQDDALPTPPPPPRQLAQLSDSLRDLSGRISSCSGPRMGSTATVNRYQSAEDDRDREDSEDHGQLVDKLLNSIKWIKDASDDIDTTTTSNDNGDDDDHEDDDEGFAMANVMAAGSHLNSDNASKSHQRAVLRQRKITSSQEQDQAAATAPVINEGIDRSSQQCTCDPRSQELLQAPKDVWSEPTALQQQQDMYHQDQYHYHQPQQQRQQQDHIMTKDVLTGMSSLPQQPSELLLSLRLPYDQMPAHVRAAIRSILFIADSIKNEDDESSAQEDWQSMSMVVDRLFLWIFLIFCTFGSIIILASAPSLYDQREPIDDKLRIDIQLSNCSALLLK